ncbi:MAG: chorismate mutase [Thermodesulfobacteriota bacterium]
MSSSPDLAKDPRMIDYRKSIDYLDISLLNLMTERMRVVEKIILIKRLQNVDLKQSEARREDMKKLIEMSVELKMESVFFQRILNLIFQDAIEQFESVSSDPQAEHHEIICKGLRIDSLRQTLYNLDRTLCLLLAERFKIVKRIGIYKHELKVPPLDPVRWEQVLNNKIKIARALGVSVSLIKEIFNAIHEVSLSIEENSLQSVQSQHA